LRTILVTFGPETPEFTLLTITPFVVIRQKSAYHAKYLRMSWAYLDLLYVGLIIPIFVWRSPKGHCYGNQLYLGDVRRRRQEIPLLFVSAFDNGLADRKSASKGLNGNNPAISCTNLVNFRPIISEFPLLKCTFFAVIRPQFSDDLYSSHLRFETDWKIVILISAEKSVIISIHLLEIW